MAYALGLLIIAFLARRLIAKRAILIKRFKLFFDIDRQYLIGETFLRLPAEHMLPEHQKSHRLYDKFLPFITQQLPKDSCVLDIGANVGDSLAAMASSNPDLLYVCIEGEESFYKYLLLNITTLLKKFPLLAVQTHQTMISSTKSRKMLIGDDGTRRGVEVATKEGGVHAVSIDEVCKGSGLENVRFIKSDVDGWDWDVILSGLEIIRRDKPIMFFEMWVTDNKTLDNYNKSLQLLAQLGYSHFYVFDCFGSFIMGETDISKISQFGEYLLRQYNQETTRSIYYIDILCGVKEDVPSMQNSINSYTSAIR